MLKLVAWFVLSFIFCLTIILAIQNANSVTVYYYVNSIDISLAVLLVFVFAVGVLLGIVFNTMWILHFRQQHQAWQQRYQQTYQELQLLLTRLNQDSVSQ